MGVCPRAPIESKAAELYHGMAHGRRMAGECRLFCLCTWNFGPKLHPSRERELLPQLWHATLLLYASTLFGVLVTTVFGTHLPNVENALLIAYFVGFVAVLIPLLLLGPHGSAEQVFSTFLNDGNWSSQTLSIFVGLSANAFAFLGESCTLSFLAKKTHADTTQPGVDSVYHVSLNLA